MAREEWRNKSLEGALERVLEKGEKRPDEVASLARVLVKWTADDAENILESALKVVS